MKTTYNIQGRQLQADDLSNIQNLIANNPGWHRTRISQELCKRWQWVNEKGQLKDIAARTLLRKLDSMELIRLPAPVRSANNEYRNQSTRLKPCNQDRRPIQCRLSDLQPIRVHQVTTPDETQLFRGLLQQYHYLGYKGPVCENFQYLICDRYERPLGCMLYGAAAWRVEDRDSLSVGMRPPANWACHVLPITCDF